MCWYDLPLVYGYDRTSVGGIWVVNNLSVSTNIGEQYVYAIIRHSIEDPEIQEINQHSWHIHQGWHGITHKWT